MTQNDFSNEKTNRPFRYELIHRNSVRKGQSIPLPFGGDDEQTPNAEAVVLAKSAIVIGRSRRSDLRLPTPDISRQHCQLTCRGDQIDMIDLNSRTGTFINRHRVSTDTPTRLISGDKLQIGQWKFRFRDTLAGDEIKQPTVSNQQVSKDDIANLNSEAPGHSSSSLDQLLSELDDIASQCDGDDFLASVTLSVDSIESERTRSKEDEKEAAKAKEQAAPSKPEDDDNTSDALDAEAESAFKSDAQDEEEPSRVSEKKERFQKLPAHLRNQGSANSTDAAGEALKRIFGG